jgi:hypothetical protein
VTEEAVEKEVVAGEDVGEVEVMESEDEGVDGIVVVVVDVVEVGAEVDMVVWLSFVVFFSFFSFSFSFSFSFFISLVGFHFFRSEKKMMSRRVLLYSLIFLPAKCTKKTEQTNNSQQSTTMASPSSRSLLVLVFAGVLVLLSSFTQEVAAQSQGYDISGVWNIASNCTLPGNEQLQLVIGYNPTYATLNGMITDPMSSIGLLVGNYPVSGSNFNLKITIDPFHGNGCLGNVKTATAVNVVCDLYILGVHQYCEMDLTLACNLCPPSANASY